MNGKHYIGAKAQTANNVYTYPPVSKVILIVDDENIFEAGTDDGFVLEKECPYATQAMADNLLAMLQGYEYQSIEADAARITPTAELGDGITVNGIYTQLAYKNIRFGNAAVVDVAAPGSVEAEHEYQQEGSTSSNTNWKLAQTYSRISKTAEEIRLEVTQTVGELSASFDVQLQSITGRIDGLDGDYAELKLTLDGLTVTGPDGLTQINGGSINTTNLKVSAANITGQLTASQINTTNLEVNAANVTGRLTIGQLPTNVATDSDIPNKVSDLYNDEGYQTERGVVEIIDGTVTADYVEALEVAAATLRGRTIYVQNNYGSSVGYISTSSADSGGSAIDITSYGAGRFEASGNLYFSGGGVVLQLGGGNIQCGRSVVASNDNTYNLGSSGIRWANVYAATGYIQTSDRNQKTDINYDLTKYDTIFDALKPASFKFIDGTSGRTHTGFISQDIEEALEFCGLTSLDLAAFIKSPKENKEGKVIEGEYTYGLRYEELIAPMVAQIQSLKSRVAALEASK